MKKNLYATRQNIIIFIFMAVAVLFVGKLFYLQIINTSYKLSSQNNVLRYMTQFPARGKMFDRNGKVLVYNESAYDMMVTPKLVKQMDTLEFCRLLKIDRHNFLARFKKASAHSRHRASIFLEQVSKEDYAYIAEKLYHFPGFYFQARTLRKYPSPIAAHILGDVGEVNQKNIDDNHYYKSGDYIGKSGMERHYEEAVRGKKGLKIVMVDVYNRAKGSFENGRYDTLPVAGKDLVLGLDAMLQQYGEELMRGKTGSVVAIDPTSGEILALVTSPGYDPNLLVGRVRGANYNKLLEQPEKPLINRAISGTYPPGSTFKLVNALVALHTGAITPSTQFSCQGKSSSPIKCTHSHQSPLPLAPAIENSCNSYFWNTFRNILYNHKYHDLKDAYEDWQNLMFSFGFGKPFDTDIPFELPGNVPTRAYFDKVYQGSWNAMTVRSLAIGQGEILLTPLQLANEVAIIGNKGFYYPPHLIRKIGDGDSIDPSYTTKRYTGIDARHFDVVKNAMRDVFEGAHGTARYNKIEGIDAGGKTGTVQNPHGEDHSLFIAFAPFDNPKIAISVVVENAGYGSQWAAPIATLMIEKYLTGDVKRKELEEKILTKNFNEEANAEQQ
ncbi:MAG: penicillin-binding protein 2 [Bacteroidales bacterium]|nr:penicillin-binding protein 2 [Bacteroidales bacterium]